MLSLRNFIVLVLIIGATAELSSHIFSSNDIDGPKHNVLKRETIKLKFKDNNDDGKPLKMNDEEHHTESLHINKDNINEDSSEAMTAEVLDDHVGLTPPAINYDKEVQEIEVDSGEMN